MRLTRRPPPFVAVLVWAVAFACLIYGTLSRSALSMPSHDGPGSGLEVQGEPVDDAQPFPDTP